MKHIPEFQTKIKVDSDFISAFIRGKGALNDVDMFSMVNVNGELNIIIGYANTNTNRVNITVSTSENGIDVPITFNANLFKEILLANKECTSAVLEVSNEGLARVNFRVDDYDSTYYIVAMQVID